VKLFLERTGDLESRVSVKATTRDGTASTPGDYVALDETIIFEPGEERKEISVKIIDDAAYENDENFFVDLSEPQNLSILDNGPENKKEAVLGPDSSATVTIIDDDEPGYITLENDNVEVWEKLEDSVLKIKVERKNGSTGVIGCKFHTKDGSAIQGCDYDDTKGEIKMVQGEMSATIDIMIKARGRYEGTEDFELYLTNPSVAKFEDGAPELVCKITILADDTQKDSVDKLASLLHMNWDKAQIGHSNWRDQFVEAIYCNGSPEDQKEASVGDWAMHILTVLWKVLFAFVPPTDFFDGWLCFFVALAMIGGVTAIIGDMAGLLGCTMDVPASITAITFVALGTSLPDTFASRTAAKQDPYADASIGNVTGSNSVNVFLGLGLPWMIASIYWASAGATDDWKETISMPRFEGDTYGADVVALYGPDGGGFVVLAGDLSYSVAVFCACALLCIGHLLLRRKMYGGELGGPEAPKYASAALYVCLWFVYIIMSSLKALGSI